MQLLELRLFLLFFSQSSTAVKERMITMKQSKKPKRWQKECLSAHGLKVDDWRIVGETDMSLIIINKKGIQKRVDKFRRLRW